MVAARSGVPSPADPRAACPVCGGLIHPIAGKCKHCKTDLTALRGGGMPASPVALPQLGQQPAPQPEVWTTRPQNGYANGHANGAMPSAVPPMAAVVGAHARGSSWSRRWPIVVVVLAAIAIVVSIVLLLKNDGDPPRSSKIDRGALPPSIDNNMNTMPMPDPGGPDPWGGAPTLKDPVPAPPPPPPPDDVDDDIFGGGTPGGVPGGVPSTGATIPAPPRDQFFTSMARTVCTRLESCGGSGAASLCSDLTDMYQSLTPALCPSYDESKASRCLTQLSNLPCLDTAGGKTWTLDQFSSLASGLAACSDACSQ
jgi:hypothetical protein